MINTEIPNLFKTIINKAIETGYFTIDELVILKSDPECWEWVVNLYLPLYERFNPVLLNISDIVNKELKK